jgi:hypothetical protein
MPFPTTTVIPAGWSKHHQAAATGGMNATVTVGTRATSTYNPATDDTTVTWTQAYGGPARVQSFMRAQQHMLAGQQISGRPYLVQLVASDPGADHLEPGMRVHVTAAGNDPGLVGQDLWVVDFQMGSERFTRDLICSDNEADAPTGP